MRRQETFRLGDQAYLKKERSSINDDHLFAWLGEAKRH